MICAVWMRSWLIRPSVIFISRRQNSTPNMFMAANLGNGTKRLRIIIIYAKLQHSFGNAKKWPFDLHMVWIFPIFAVMKRISRFITYRNVLFAVLLALPAMVWSQDFFSTRTVTKKTGRFSASVEFPTEGPSAAMDSVLSWIKAVVGAPGCSSNDFSTILQAAADNFASGEGGGNRTVLIERAYEDGGCVTFESMVTDKGSDTWRTADCASFSKSDGHRITIGEIFSCDMDGLRRLMWQYKGDLSLDAEGPEGLQPIAAGFIDGWVVVIGNARKYHGAPYRLRYEEIEDCLRTNPGGYYSIDE